MSLSFLDQISKQFHSGLPFVAYRKPNEVDVKVIFQKDQELYYVNDYTESGFVFAPFNAHSPAVLIKNEETFVETFESGPGYSDSTITFPLDKDSDKDFYLKLINKAIDKIESGTITK